MKYLTAILVLALASAASAQDGGRLTWLGKGRDPVDPVFEDAKKAQQPLLIFFSCEGDPVCKAVCEGAFSHPDVIAATRKITCIWVDCGRDGRGNGRLVEALRVKDVPTLILCDREGHVIGELNRYDGPGMARWLKALTNVSDGLPTFPEDVEGAYQGARARGQALLIYFYDDSPPSLAVNRSLNDPELAPLHRRFSVCRTPMKKGSSICTQFDVDRAPTILVLDPRAPEKPLARITSSRSPRELRRDLEEALGAVRGAAPGAPTDPAKAPLPAPAPAPAPKEVLSDDEVDRRFIRARFSLATELAGSGKKAQAIEVLEDVLKTFPKHVETVVVKKFLDDLKQ